MSSYNKTADTISGLLGLAVIIFMLTGVGGYVSNIVKLIHMHNEVSAELTIRLVGIFVVPLGALMGFL